MHLGTHTIAMAKENNNESEAAAWPPLKPDHAATFTHSFFIFLSFFLSFFSLDPGFFSPFFGLGLDRHW